MAQIADLRRKYNDAFFVGESQQSLLAASKFLEKVTTNAEQAPWMLEQPDAP